MNERANERMGYNGVQNYRSLPHWIVIGYVGLSNVSPQTERRPLGNVGGDHSSKGIGTGN